jgi:ribulose-5-phosphate 4-epimerase/fuculose-1-phosphate aldolase
LHFFGIWILELGISKLQAHPSCNKEEIMKNKLNATLDRFTAAARRVAGHGLVLGASGNLSARAPGGRLLITATGSWKGNLTRAEIAVCRIADAAALNGIKPSKEIGFHAGILRERPEINFVLHCNSPWATAIACRRPPVASFYVIPEIPYYIGPVPTIPYLDPGSKRLAQAVITAMRAHELVILRNHGQVVVGRDLDEVISRALYFEMACQIILAAGKFQCLPRSESAALVRQGRKHRSAWTKQLSVTSDR